MRTREVKALALGALLWSWGCAELGEDVAEQELAPEVTSTTEVVELEPESPAEVAATAPPAPLAAAAGASWCGCPRGVPLQGTPGDQEAPAEGEGSLCRLGMLDDINEIDTIIEVEWTGPCSLEVTDGVGSDSPWVVHVQISETGLVETDAGAPRVTCHELIEEDSVAADQDGQLTFLVDEDSPCTSFEKGVIYFLVMEWFYFG